MKTTAHSSTCPWCKKVSTHATDARGEDRPNLGDVSVCLYCLMPAIFTEDGVRSPTIEEFLEIFSDADFRQMQQGAPAFLRAMN